MHASLEVLSELAHGAWGLGFIGFQVVALLSVPSVLLRRRSKPIAKLSWLLALFAVPAIGVLAWWLIGRTSMARKSRRRMRSARAYAERCKMPCSQTGTSFDLQVPRRALGRAIFPTADNRVTLLVNGEEAFPAMQAAIRAAERSVNLLFYIFKDDETGTRIRDLLVERARAGVKVRLLVDAKGSTRFTRRFARPLLEAGAQVAWFFPTRLLKTLAKPRINFVNHRKILVVDGAVGFTGGMNVGDEYARRWEDMMVQIEGPGVEALQHVFLDDWYFATGEIVEELADLRPIRTSLFPPPPAGRVHQGVECAVVASGPDSEDWIHDSYFAALAQARKRIWIATPYFIPSPSLLMALRTAANRGVDVRVVVPHKSDIPLVSWASRSYYPQLLQAEVKIYEYQSKVLHAKAWLVDDRESSVGTANVDSRSFRLSFEVICLFLSEKLNASLATWHQGLVDSSRQVSREEVRRTSTAQKLLESAANMLSPLL